MGYNPFKERGVPVELQLKNWSSLKMAPYDKNEVHPFTRCRIITANGAEVEAAFFGHQYARHIDDMTIKQKLAMTRRAEQQQQKTINWLIPANESVLENTIGYEQVAVELTAGVAQMEPDPYVKSVFDFGLLEDFDHLYRYANLLEMTEGVKAEKLVGELTEIIPGRPTIFEHRHPFDDIRKHYDASKADIRTQLHSMMIVAAEQQTMNFYMNVGNRSSNETGRALYQEIGMVEEQHVTQYESLLDPTTSWCLRDVMHHYCEAYMYHSFFEHEVDPRFKQLWELYRDMEVGQLKVSAETMKKIEGKDPEDQLGEFPESFVFKSNVDYVRKILAEQVDWTAKETKFVPTADLPDNYRFFGHQIDVNGSWVPSQSVIQEHVEKRGSDYRFEIKGPHPVERFRSREEVTI
jgi:rubrerythrin